MATALYAFTGIYKDDKFLPAGTKIPAKTFTEAEMKRLVKVGSVVKYDRTALEGEIDLDEETDDDDDDDQTSPSSSET